MASARRTPSRPAARFASIVDSDKINDEEAFLLCREAAKKIETELTYPGQIKVTVIRETRAVEYAR